MQRIRSIVLCLMLVCIAMTFGSAHAKQTDEWNVARGRWQQAYERLLKGGYSVDVKSEYIGGVDTDSDVRTIRCDKGKFSLVLNWAGYGEKKSFGTIANGNYFVSVEKNDDQANASWTMKDIVLGQDQNNDYKKRVGESHGSNYFEKKMSGHGLLPYLFDSCCEIVTMQDEQERSTFTVRFTKAEVPSKQLTGENFRLPKLAKITFSKNVAFPTELLTEWPDQWMAITAENVNANEFHEKFSVFSSKSLDDLFQHPVATYWISNFRRLESGDAKYFTLAPFGIREPVIAKKPLPLWIWIAAVGCCLLVISVFLKKTLRRT